MSQVKMLENTTDVMRSKKVVESTSENTEDCRKTNKPGSSHMLALQELKPLKNTAELNAKNDLRDGPVEEEIDEAEKTDVTESTSISGVDLKATREIHFSTGQGKSNSEIGTREKEVGGESKERGSSTSTARPSNTGPFCSPVDPTRNPSNEANIYSHKNGSFKLVNNTRSNKDNEDGKNILKELGLFALKTAVISGAIIGGTAIALPAIGFGTLGVTGGSLAAAYQSSVLGGTIASGSVFATLQSVGMAGLSAATNGAIVAGSAAASGAHSILKSNKKK